MRVRIGLAVGFALALAVTGCGVPAESEPRAITVDSGRSAKASGPGTAVPEVDASDRTDAIAEVLYFVRDGRLVAVRRAVDRLPASEKHLEHLLAGPSDAEHDQGLSSALTGLGITARLRVERLTAVVDLGVRPENAGRSDEVLAYGQLVCTLTSRPDIDTVSFHYDGEPVDVPRGDASLGRQPLTADDYRRLVAAG
jgi:spore germination protein GerM